MTRIPIIRQAGRSDGFDVSHTFDYWTVPVKWRERGKQGIWLTQRRKLLVKRQNSMHAVATSWFTRNGVRDGCRMRFGKYGHDAGHVCWITGCRIIGILPFQNSLLRITIESYFRFKLISVTFRKIATDLSNFNFRLGLHSDYRNIILFYAITRVILQDSGLAEFPSRQRLFL